MGNYFNGYITRLFLTVFLVGSTGFAAVQGSPRKGTSSMSVTLRRLAALPFTGTGFNCKAAKNDAQQTCVDWAKNLDEKVVGIPQCSSATFTCSVEKQEAKAIVLGIVPYEFKWDPKIPRPSEAPVFTTEGTGLDCWSAIFDAKEELFGKVSAYSEDYVVEAIRPEVCRCKSGIPTLAVCTIKLSVY